MNYYTLILIGLSLSLDTFAVSVSAGLCNKNIRFLPAVRLAAILAIFQGTMPLIGWMGGSQFLKNIEGYDHWIAFVLFSAIGIKMVIEAFNSSDSRKINPFNFKIVIGIAIATSIDALVVGLSMAFISVNILLAIVIIGIITFFAAMIGMLLGKNVTGRFGRKVEALGGIILIGIGVKVLAEHLAL